MKMLEGMLRIDKDFFMRKKKLLSIFLTLCAFPLFGDINSQKEEITAAQVKDSCDIDSSVRDLVNKEEKMQNTLVILKPDCMEKNLAGEIIKRFNDAKFEIVACKMMGLSETLLKEHYAHIAHLPFFPEIVSFMQSKPVIVLVLRGQNIIEKVRNLLGPTDSKAAPKGSIRGDFGTDKMRNIAHASDSDDSAQKEINRFFRVEEIFIK